MKITQVCPSAKKLFSCFNKTIEKFSHTPSYLQVKSSNFKISRLKENVLRKV